jgi:hypothetical protein
MTLVYCRINLIYCRLTLDYCRILVFSETIRQDSSSAYYNFTNQQNLLHLFSEVGFLSSSNFYHSQLTVLYPYLILKHVGIL